MVGERLQKVERLYMSAVMSGVKGMGGICDFLGTDLL